jgi:anti-anti-sigma regulatory factor
LFFSYENNRIEIILILLLFFINSSLVHFLLFSLIVIHIEESFDNDESVLLRIEGRLDRESLPALRRVCEGHLEANRAVQLHVGGVDHIGKEGRDFLRSIREKVSLLGLNEYLKMAIHDVDQGEGA